ncbi:MAG: hypothetical protein RIT47_734 [Pseudomonadota bacterium]
MFNLFNIDLPHSYKTLIKRKKSKYIAIEYLSAEPWVDNFHLKPSIDPQSGLIKTFFYPGFTNQTGGLIREKGLFLRREAFNQSRRKKFIQSLGGDPNLYSISLFYYPIQKIEVFLDVIDHIKKPAQFFIPQYLFDLLKLKNNYQFIHIIPYPFLNHDDFDNLLWSCDLNFVRGEDSWTRAIWAGKPFIWQPYIQENNIHLIKLKAFLKRYCEACDQDLSEILIKMHDDWSNNKFNEVLWRDFFKQQARLETFVLNFCIKAKSSLFQRGFICREFGRLLLRNIIFEYNFTLYLVSIPKDQSLKNFALVTLLWLALTLWSS